VTTEQMDWLDDQANALAAGWKAAALAEFERNRVEPLVENFDECECGDYRLSHDNGRGKCSLPNDATHGWKPCKKFRRFVRAGFVPEPWAKWLGEGLADRNPHLRPGGKS